MPDSSCWTSVPRRCTAQGHLPRALNLPHAKLVRGKLSAYPADTLFVVYCAGSHCNGADKAALRLATLQRPVKLMIGGITRWLDEGFALVCENTGADAA